MKTGRVLRRRSKTCKRRSKTCKKQYKLKQTRLRGGWGGLGLGGTSIKPKLSKSYLMMGGWGPVIG